LDGILMQTTSTIRSLIGIAAEGAPTGDIAVAYQAIRDQWESAGREAAGSEDASVRFEARAAAVIGTAYRPVLDALCEGRSIASVDVELARRGADFVGLAHEAMVAGDLERAERCLGFAAAIVGLDPSDELDRPTG
jgi:hypothetical protein